MRYDIEDIISRVRVLMDMNEMEYPVLESDVDTLCVSDIIRANVVPAANFVLKNAQASCFTEGLSLMEGDELREVEERPEKLNPGEKVKYVWGRSIYNGSVNIDLPPDVVRVLCVKTSSDILPSYDIIDSTSAEYYKQRSRIESMRGTPEHVIAVVHHNNSGLGLKVFGMKSEDKIVTLCGVCRPDVATDIVDVPESLVSSMLYMTASLSYAVMNDNRHSVMKTIAYEQLGIGGE